MARGNSGEELDYSQLSPTAPTDQEEDLDQEFTNKEAQDLLARTRPLNRRRSRPFPTDSTELAAAPTPVAYRNKAQMHW